MTIYFGSIPYVDTYTFVTSSGAAGVQMMFSGTVSGKPVYLYVEFRSDDSLPYLPYVETFSTHVVALFYFPF